MQSHAQALIVGGGVVGVSIAYHLARAGWQDVVLLERDELTSGSTWHAAGLLPLFNMSYAASHIHDYSVKFYKQLEDETGLNPGFKVVGNLRMAQTQERMDEYRLYATTAETVGIPYEWLSPKDIGERYPLVRSSDLKGAIFHPTDGYINPSDLTQAMASGGRRLGVDINRRCQVDRFEWLGSEWLVRGTSMDEKGGNLLPKGEFEIRAENIITATGNHAQRTARLLGIKIPVIPVEHQYIVTDVDQTLAKWRESNPEHPVLRDADAKWYVREERNGWILGPYERGAPARFVDGVPEAFRADLFPLDLDRIEEEYMSMLHRIPSSAESGLKDDFNGPICYTPDGNPLVGPAPGLRNMWLAEGFSFGVTAAGGVGHYLAQLMTEGDAEIDMSSLDPRRFGNWMTTEYACTKNKECYEHVYILHHPDEEREACRPLKTAPCYERLRDRGACFGQVNGWERPNYFAPKDFDDAASRSFRKGGWWNYTLVEAKAVRQKVGLFDATSFAKHRVTGPGAKNFLNWFTCNRLPGPGEVRLTYALTDKGVVHSEYTIAHCKNDEYYLVSSGAWTAYDADFMRQAAAECEDKFGRIEIYDVSSQWGVFALAGPQSRNLLQDALFLLAPKDSLSNKKFPWLTVRELELGMCPIRALRVSYTGALGWELHHPIEMQNYLFDRLESCGKRYDLKHFGARAQNWLRLEKSYRAVGAELGRDATPLESGIDRFVDQSKEFRGKAKMFATPIRSLCVTVLVDAPDDYCPWGREAIYVNDKKVGRLTSGGFSPHFGQAIGMGYVQPEFATVGTALKIKVLNQLWSARIVENSPYDPTHSELRQDG